MNQLRILWSVAALLVAGAFLLVQAGCPQPWPKHHAGRGDRVSAPDWTFVVHGMQDPYCGALTTPPEPAPGMRYVGFDVEVVNESDQPLSFAGTGVYLRDEEGVQLSQRNRWWPRAGAVGTDDAGGRAGPRLGLVRGARRRNADRDPARARGPGSCGSGWLRWQASRVRRDPPPRRTSPSRRRRPQCRT